MHLFWDVKADNLVCDLFLNSLDLELSIFVICIHMADLSSYLQLFLLAESISIFSLY